MIILVNSQPRLSKSFARDNHIEVLGKNIPAISVLTRPFWHVISICCVYGPICDEITDMLYKAIKDVCFPPPSLYNESCFKQNQRVSRLFCGFV